MLNATFEKGKVILISAGHMINDSYGGFLTPLLPLFMKQYDLSVTQAAILSSTLAFSASFLQPFFGFVADKTRKTFLILVGPLITAVFLSSLNLATSFFTLLLIVFIGGLGIAAFHPVGATLARLHSGHSYNTGMSWFATGGNLGYSAGPIIITSIVALGGMPATHFTIIPGLLIVFLIWKFIPEKEFPVHPKNNVNHSHFAMRTALGVIIAIVTIKAFIICGFATFIPIYIAEQGSSLSTGGIHLFIFLGVGTFGVFWGGMIADKIGEKIIIVLSFLVPIPFLIVYVYSPFPWNLVILAMGSFCLYSSIPIVISIAQNIFIHRISTISSIVMGFCWGIGGLLVIPFGPVAENFGTDSAITLIACSSVIGFAASLVLYSKILSSLIITSQPKLQRGKDRGKGTEV